jgi:hypothetical protein
MYVVNSINMFMIISHKYRFIFVRTQKTASTSIMKYLYNYLGPDDICTGDGPDNIPLLNVTSEEKFQITKHHNNHLGHEWISKKYPVEWKEYYKFAVERNPWDKAVSFYCRLIHLNKKRAANGFDHFCKTRLKHASDWNKYAHNGSIVVNEVFKYEDLHNTLIKNKVLPYDSELLTTFSKSEFREKKDYKSFYNNETNLLIEKTFSNEIKHFNYSKD